MLPLGVEHKVFSQKVRTLDVNAGTKTRTGAFHYDTANGFNTSHVALAMGHKQLIHPSGPTELLFWLAFRGYTRLFKGRSGWAWAS